MSFIDQISGLESSAAVKIPVVAATTGPITAYGAQVIDTYSVLDGDRILRKDETDPTLNGVYIASTTSAWLRAIDFDGARDVTNGTQVFVRGGSANLNYTYYLISPDVIVTPSISAMTFGRVVYGPDPTSMAAIAAAQGYANAASLSANAAAASAAGFKFKNDVRASTTAALPASTYTNGTSGAGATLTATANGAFPAQDGITLAVGERLLVQNQAAPAQNGIFSVTQTGSGTTPWILTRAIDMDQSSEVNGASVIVDEGTLYADTAWLCTTNQNPVIGTTAIAWIPFPSYLPDGSLLFAKLAASALASLADIIAGTANKLITAASFAPLLYSTKATQTTGTVLPNNTLVVIAFAGEEYDDGGWHDTVTSNSRITVNFTGRVFVCGYLDFNTASNGNCKLEIYKNGSLVQSNSFAGPAAIGIKHSIMGEFSCAPNDYFELFALQAIGASVTTGTTGFLSVARLK